MLPAALPKIFAGLRISLSIALLLMSSRRWSASPTASATSCDTRRPVQLPDMWAWVVLLGALGYLFNTLLLVFERRTLR
ncbi:hypothetical protein [Kibdelosporangium philippinense]|uniref:hypothetical protein n=1 Tax=Kibdelosporangium philippinense TaxID=211113 RepID=UPI00361CF533